MVYVPQNVVFFVVELYHKVVVHYIATYYKNHSASHSSHVSDIQGRRQVFKLRGLINKACVARWKILGHAHFSNATLTLKHVRTPVNC